MSLCKMHHRKVNLSVDLRKEPILCQFLPDSLNRVAATSLFSMHSFGVNKAADNITHFVEKGGSCFYTPFMCATIQHHFQFQLEFILSIHAQ